MTPISRLSCLLERALAAGVLTILTASALAAPPAFTNLDLARQDTDGKPSGWTTSGEGQIAIECAPDCALRVGSRAAPGTPAKLAAYQWIGAAPAAGARLVFSGRLRTDRVADAARPFISTLVGQQQSWITPVERRGSSAWSGFRVEAEVPADAAMVAIGIMLDGAGTLWADQLKVEVDGPARPAKVDPAWRADVAARRHAIASLTSDDFSDLQFLKPLLAGKRVVQLGEAAHGVAQFNQAKVRLIKFLHREMGFDVVAFESSLAGCYDADAQVGRLAPREVMRHCLYPIWHTEEVRPLFDYMGALRQAGKPIALAGFDVQISARAPSQDQGARLRTMLDLAPGPAAQLSTQLSAHEARLAKGTVLSAQEGAVLRQFYHDVAATLGRQRAHLHAAGHPMADIDLEIQAAHARAALARQFEHLDTPNSQAGNEIRDAAMAANLDFLLDTLYAGRKVVVWGHNMHLSHAPPAGAFANMGGRLAQQRRRELYTVGFYMGRGRVSNGYATVWDVHTPSASTLEGVLASTGLPYAMVDFSQAGSAPGTGWFTAPNTVREFGTMAQTIVPARAYDAVFYVDSVTPPEQFQ